MKKVILDFPIPNEVVELKNVSECKFYGVDLKKQQGGKAFITKKGRHGDVDNYYELKSALFLTGGGGCGYSNGERESLKYYITHLIKDCKLDVIEFNTFLELAQWLSEK